MNSGRNAAPGNFAFNKCVKLLVISDGQLKETRVDAPLVLLEHGVAGKFHNFCAQVLEDGSQVNAGGLADPLRTALLQTLNATRNWK